VQATIVFFSQMRSNWTYDHPEMLSGFGRFYVEKLLIQNGCPLDATVLPSRLVDPIPPQIKHGGTEQRSIISTIVKTTLGFEGIYDCLFRQSQLWTVEDCATSDIWYIGILAHTDNAFRKALRDYLYCYRSPFNVSETMRSDQILGSTFNVTAIVDQVQNALSSERIGFLKTVIVRGTSPMLMPFLDTQIDFNEGKILDNYLGHASARGELSMVNLLLDAGANSARALTNFLLNADLETSEFSALYSKLLDNVTPSKSPRSTRPDFPDPVNVILETTRTKDVRSDAIRILLESGSFQAGCLYGASYIYVCHSYVSNAILYNRPAALELFLGRGAQANCLIEHAFATDREHFQSLKHHTWLTIAVELGRTSCVKILLKHAQDITDIVTSPDGAGRSAISLARSHAGAIHPRASIFADPYWATWLADGMVSDAADGATLSFLEGVLAGIEPANSPTAVASSMAKSIPHQVDFDKFSRRFSEPLTLPFQSAINADITKKSWRYPPSISSKKSYISHPLVLIIAQKYNPPGSTSTFTSSGSYLSPKPSS
jgi:hypothetical protein